MNRTHWLFTYSADKLLAAAQAKRNWHKDRHNWWKNQKVDVLEKIKAEGLEIDESVAMGYSNTGRNTSVNVRYDLLKDLNECVAKVEEHDKKTKDYDAWVQVLESQGQASLQLNQDDWLFFFGK